MRILVTGAAGRLGGRLVETLAADHDVTGIDLAELDITDFSAARAFVTDLRPAFVLHPAAWTDVDGCARDPDKAVLVNGLGAGNMAVAAYEAGAAILYVSSNEVFDGRQSFPYSEYDATQPANPYGYSKRVGERAVMQANPRHMIVRTAWLFAHGGRNFIHSILNAAREGRALRVVTDEVANPTYNDDLAEAIAALIQTGRYGTYHLTNEGACSRYTMARYVLDQTGFAATPIEPIVSYQWPRPSQPPGYTALANLAARSLGIALRPWQAAVDEFLRREGLSARSSADAQ
jgi:dTDP-4-dehydrorhamnose reductase